MSCPLARSQIVWTWRAAVTSVHERYFSSSADTLRGSATCAMARLRDSWRISLSMAALFGNPTRLLQPETVSDLAIGAAKPANNDGQPSAELVERRAGAEGNAGQDRTRRAQDRANVSQGLDRVRHVARQRKKERFTALLHHVTPDLLRTAFFALRRQAAPGVDGLTCQAYEADLDRRIEDLHERVHRGAYRALPARRGFIPKAEGSQRPLAITALEDKIVQDAVVAIL